MSRGLTVVSRLRSVSFRSLIFRNGSQTRAGEAEPPAPDLRLFWKVPENRNSSPPREAAPQPQPARSTQWPELDPRRAPSPLGSAPRTQAEARVARPRPLRIVAGCVSGVASPAQPAPRSPRRRTRMQIGHVTAKAAWPSPVPQSIYGQRRHGH